MEGFERVGYSQLMSMADVACTGILCDKRAKKLYDELIDFSKQARFQNYRNFQYDVQEVINSLYSMDADYGNDRVFTKIHDMMYGKHEYDSSRG